MDKKQEDELLEMVRFIKDRVAGTEEKVESLETRFDSLEGRVISLEDTVNSLGGKIDRVDLKLENFMGSEIQKRHALEVRVKTLEIKKA